MTSAPKTAPRPRLLVLRGVAIAAMAWGWASAPAARAAPLCEPGGAPGAAAAAPAVELVTLGTAGGPRPRIDRAQSSNLLLVDGAPYLVDAGEGVTQQITRAGVDFRSVGQVFITHAHSDHTLGLPALIASQWEFQRRDPVVVHGPLGIRRFMDGLLRVLEVNREIRSAEGFPQSLSAMVRADEVGPGVIYRDSRVTVTAAENTHYNFPVGSAPYGRHKSYAYRFDAPGRSLVFTGDTGPSPALVTLARGADVLVAEVSDPDELLASYKRNGIWDRKSPTEQAAWLRHQENEHLTPAAVAALARSAGVKTVVLTHFPPADAPIDDFRRRIEAVRKGFAGQVCAAKDLDRF